MTAQVSPVVAGASWDDLDPREFARLRRLVSAAGRQADTALADLTDREMALALGVARMATPGGTGLVAAGAGDQRGTAHLALLPEALLLFGRPASIRWFVPQHEAAMILLRGDDAEVSDFFHWPLLRLAEELLAGFRTRNTTRTIRYELVRVPVPTWSEDAFRELLTNALIHRDYTVPGVVHVRWADTGIEITNPVRPATGPRPAALGGLPDAPNPLLADAFRRAGIARRTGRGRSRAVAAQLRYGLAAPRFEPPADGTLRVVLPHEPADLAFARYVVARERRSAPLGRAELQLLTTLLRRGPLRTADAAAVLTTDRAQARIVLFGLVRAGLVQVGTDSGGRTWSLTDLIRRDLRDNATHIRAQQTPGQPAAPPAPPTAAGPAMARPATAGPAAQPAPPLLQPAARSTAQAPAPGPAASSGWAIPDAGPALPHWQQAGG